MSVISRIKKFIYKQPEQPAWNGGYTELENKQFAESLLYRKLLLEDKDILRCHENIPHLRKEYLVKLVLELLQENKEHAVAREHLNVRLDAMKKSHRHETNQRESFEKAYSESANNHAMLKYNYEILHKRFAEVHGPVQQDINNKNEIIINCDREIKRLERELEEAKNNIPHAEHIKLTNHYLDLSGKYNNEVDEKLKLKFQLEELESRLAEDRLEYDGFVNKYYHVVDKYNNVVDKIIALTEQLEAAEQEIKILRAKDDFRDAIDDHKEREANEVCNECRCDDNEDYDESQSFSNMLQDFCTEQAKKSAKTFGRKLKDCHDSIVNRKSFVGDGQCGDCGVNIKYHDKKHCEIIKSRCLKNVNFSIPTIEEMAKLCAEMHYHTQEDKKLEENKKPFPCIKCQIGNLRYTNVLAFPDGITIGVKCTHCDFCKEI
jgi:hypothetical protein